MSEFILEKEHDYKSLFEFKYDFELLSKLMEALVKVTRQSDKKIEDLMERDGEKEKLITNFKSFSPAFKPRAFSKTPILVSSNSLSPVFLKAQVPTMP